MPHSQTQRQRRENLWRASPHCHWCGVLTVLLVTHGKEKRLPDNLATVDHLRPRYDPARGSDDRESTVLACRKCNQDRDVRDYNALPIDERRRRSGKCPLTLACVEAEESA